ncbi:MAG TPA: YciI family protein [Acidisarcina sp.]
MQYLLLIYEDEKRFLTGYDEGEFAEYGAFGKKHASEIKAGQALQPSAAAKTVRVRNGKAVVTDEPFAETKEQLGGYYLIEADSIDAATEIAAGIPGGRFGGIEVRPIMVFS